MIQIDIPMPKNCGECPICNEYLMCGVPCNGRGWGENDVSDYFINGRPEWCPLKEQAKTKVVFGRTKDGEFVTECGNCGTYLGKAYSNCPKCKKELDWNSNQT